MFDEDEIVDDSDANSDAWDGDDWNEIFNSSGEETSEESSDSD